MNITQIAELTAAAKEAVEKVDHQAEYNKLMRQSAAHQRIADGLAQSHQEEDYPLYTEHAGKAWRLGNKAMEHFKRMTKEERAMLKKQSWDGMQQPQPGRASFGNKQKQFMKGMAAYATTETIKKNWDVRADWAEFDQQREAAGKTRGGVADLARRQARQGKFEQKMMHRVLTREGWRQATKADLANPVVKKAVDDANDGNQNRIWNKYLQRGVSPSTRVYTSDSRPNEVITTNKYGSAYGQHNWMHSKLYQPGDVQNPNIHISPIYRSTSGGGQESLYKHLRGGAPPEALGFSGAKKVQADWTQFDEERNQGRPGDRHSGVKTYKSGYFGKVTIPED